MKRSPPQPHWNNCWGIVDCTTIPAAAARVSGQLMEQPSRRQMKQLPWPSRWNNYSGANGTTTQAAEGSVIQKDNTTSTRLMSDESYSDGKENNLINGTTSLAADGATTQTRFMEQIPTEYVEQLLRQTVIRASIWRAQWNNYQCRIVLMMIQLPNWLTEWPLKYRRGTGS